MLSYCSSEKKIGKTVKNCSPKTLFGQKLGLNKISPDLLKLRTKAEKSDIQFLQHT